MRKVFKLKGDVCWKMKIVLFDHGSFQWKICLKLHHPHSHPHHLEKGLTLTPMLMTLY
jgi:hypothetical protein